MPTAQDLQDLIRLITKTKHVSMLTAMTQVKALQAADLRR